jgi:hypothetical protein
VCRVEGVQQAKTYLGHALRWQRPLHVEGRRETGGPDELHHDVGAPVVGHDVVDSDDARVAEPSRQPRLAQGALAQHVALLGRQVGGEPDLLDGDLSVQHQILGEPHLTHAAAAQHGQQPVPADQHPRLVGHAPCLPDLQPAR